MSSLLDDLVAAEQSSGEQEALCPVVIPGDSPYRIVLARLKRLVEYRTSMTLRLGTDPKAGAELNRVDGMIKEVHRAVSINPDARALAERIDAAG
jgi:hypothetical protein